jgi:hypothetical protein
MGCINKTDYDAVKRFQVKIFEQMYLSPWSLPSHQQDMSIKRQLLQK